MVIHFLASSTPGWTKAHLPGQADPAAPSLPFIPVAMAVLFSWVPVQSTQLCQPQTASRLLTWLFPASYQGSMLLMTTSHRFPDYLYLNRFSHTPASPPQEMPFGPWNLPRLDLNLGHPPETCDTGRRLLLRSIGSGTSAPPLSPRPLTQNPGLALKRA